MLCKKMNGNKVESYILTKIKVQKKVNLSDMTHLFDHVLNNFSKIEYLTKLAFDSFLMKKNCNRICICGLLFFINRNFVLNIFKPHIQ